MKYTYLLMATSIGLLVGCSQVEQNFSDVNSRSDGDLVEKVIFEVLPIKDGDDPETKASAVPNGGSVGFVWEATDTVGIYPDKGSQVYFNIEDGVGTSSVSFTGGGWALKQNSTYVSYYPFVGDIYLKRDKIPVSFIGQKQIGTTSPFVGARYYLATGASTSENGVLRFSYSTLNTIINVNATLPAGTYTKASLTIEEPLFVEEGTYSLDDRVIVGSKFTNTLEIDLKNVTLTQEGVLPIYIMSAPVDLKNKEVTVKVISSDGQRYECVKTPSKAYEAGTRYGLTCDNMEEVSIINFADPAVKAICVANWDTDGDGELDMDEAAAVTELPAYGSDNMFRENKNITSFDELQYFTGLTEIRYGAFLDCSNLVSITLPESITAIRGQAFDGCSKLASLDIPKSIRSIGDYAFYACSSLTHFDIPEGAEIDVTTLAGTSIESIIIPTCTFVMRAGSMNADFRRHVYGDCISSITYSGSLSGTSMVVNLRSSLTTLYFDRNFALTYDSGDGFIGGFEYPDNNLSSIAVSSDNLLFDSRDNCNALINTATNTLLVGAKTTAIPESVSAIAPGAFIGLNYSSPFSITVPASVANIGSYAFRPHPSSSYSYSVFFLASEPPTLGDDCFGNDTENENLDIYVPSGSVNAYKNADGWNEYADRIQAIPSTNEINGHAYVDMGNGLKWATMNLGANSPSETGDYFAWGEIITYYSSLDPLTWKDDSRRYTTMSPYTSYYFDYPYTIYTKSTQTVLLPENDAAHCFWGGTWRMPTDEEWRTLIDTAKYTWAWDSTRKGFTVTSISSGNSIFLPATGYFGEDGLVWCGTDGLYWSSSLGSGNSRASVVHFNAGGVAGSSLLEDSRHHGIAVRPVSN